MRPRTKATRRVALVLAPALAVGAPVAEPGVPGIQSSRLLGMPEERARSEPVASDAQDSHEQAVRALLDRFANHDYFRRIDYTRIDHAPFVFFVQRPPKDNPDYAAGITELYVPWLREIESIFAEEFVRPLDLERRKATPYVVFVLASSGAYKDFADALGIQGLYRLRAHYNPELQVAVTYHDAFGKERDRIQTERHAMLHEFVHAMQHAHYPDEEALPGNPWLTEGIADYLAAHDQVMPAVLREHLSHKDALETVLAVSKRPALARAILFPLQELLELTDYGQVVEAAFERAKALGGIRYDYSEPALAALYAQSSLWIHFLRHGEGGRYRERFDSFFRRVHGGEEVYEAFTSAFADVPLRTLDHEFRKHLNREARTRLSGRAIPHLSAAPFYRKRAAEAAAASAPAATVFEPEQLLPDPEDPEIAFAGALGTASTGAFSAAREELSDVANGSAPEWTTRARAEIERLDELIRQRRRFVEHLRGIGRKLNLMIDDRRLLALIESVEQDVLLLGESEMGLDRLALDDIDAVQLADLMLKRKYRFDHRWSAGYAYLLNGDRRWKRYMDSDDALARAIRRDAEADYPGWLATAAAVRELRRLAALGVPEDPDEATAALEAVKDLDRSDAAIVEEHRAAMRAYAQALLESVFRGGGLKDVLAGDVEELTGGRIRIAYSFADEKELEDFTVCPGESGPSGFELGRGTLSAGGGACLRHRLAFEGEQVISFKYRFLFPPGSSRGQMRLQIGFNADELGNCVSYNHGGVEVIDRNHHDSAGFEVPQNVEQQLAIKLAFDGERSLDVYVNEREAARLDCGPRVKGGFFLRPSGTLIFELSSLSIEGAVTPESLDLVRAEWVGQQLEAAGLR